MRTAPRPLDRLSIALMLVLCASWGVNQVAIKLALPVYAPVTQSALRCWIGVAIVGVWAWRAKPGIFRSDGTLVAGLVAGALFATEFILIFIAVKLTTASSAVVFIYTAPFFVALGSILFLPNERLRTIQWIGMALAFAGVAVGFQRSAEGANPLGDVLALLGGAAWGATTVVIKATRLRAAEPAKTLLYQIGVTAVASTVVAVAVGEPWPAELRWVPTLSLLYQSVWVVGITYPVWFWLLTTYRAGELSTFTFLTPIFGVLAAALVLGERLNASLLISLVLVAAGILLANWPAGTGRRG
jgi:drug/metabolite transporter (DMT)-like permease